MSDEIYRRMQILEEKFSYQEKTIDALNDVIIDQQAQLDLLKEQIIELRGRLVAVQDSAYSPLGGDDPPPPHY